MFRKIKLILLILALALPMAAHAADKKPDFISKDGVPMAYIPGGKFVMGTTESDHTEVAPPHKVEVSAFYMDIYEVTNEQFAEFLSAMKMEETPGGKRWRWIVLRSDLEASERKEFWPTEIELENGVYKAFEGYERHPVISVSWEAATEYCKWVGKRLPTEAEWEFAARGGLEEKKYPWGDALPNEKAVVYQREWRNNADPQPTAKVGSLYPNAYGLYDMSGNVWEWCSDWFEPSYYFDSAPVNPQGPASGFVKTLRGGSWFNPSEVLKVSSRNFDYPMALIETVGFRCVLESDKVATK